MTAKDQEDNFDKNNLDIPDKDTEETLEEVLKAGNAMLAAEEAAKNPVKPVEPVTPATPAVKVPVEKNVYKRAHNQILEKWLKKPNTAWKAKEIVAMEEGRIPKDYHYDSFVEEVVTLGDSF